MQRVTDNGHLDQLLDSPIIVLCLRHHFDTTDPGLSCNKCGMVPDAVLPARTAVYFWQNVGETTWGLAQPLITSVVFRGPDGQQKRSVYTPKSQVFSLFL